MGKAQLKKISVAVLSLYCCPTLSWAAGSWNNQGDGGVELGLPRVGIFYYPFDNVSLSGGFTLRQHVGNDLRNGRYYGGVIAVGNEYKGGYLRVGGEIETEENIHIGCLAGIFLGKEQLDIDTYVKLTYRVYSRFLVGIKLGPEFMCREKERARLAKIGGGLFFEIPLGKLH